MDVTRMSAVGKNVLNSSGFVMQLFAAGRGLQFPSANRENREPRRLLSDRQRLQSHEVAFSFDGPFCGQLPSGVRFRPRL